MPMNKPHLEFHPVDMNEGWHTPAGYPAGIKQKILASDLDEGNKMGSRSRLLKFDPGVYTTAPFVHDHWEEVYLMSGDLIVGNDAQGKGGETFVALLQIDDGVEDALRGLPEYQEVLESAEGSRAAPPVVEQLTVIGSYRLF